MALYEADKIIQLLRLCSWKAGTEMAHTGLMDLTAKLGKIPDGNEQVPNEKYLVDLLDDAKKALKDDNTVTKRKPYIDLLLQYGGFNGWREWKDAYQAPAEYLYKDLQELSELAEIKIAIWHTDLFTKQINPILDKIKPTFKYPVYQLTCQEEAPANYAASLLSQLKEYAFIVWLIPVGWKDQPKQMTEPTWKELMETGRIIPVWMNPDDIKKLDTPFIPELTKLPVISNIRDLYAALLYLEEKINHFLEADQPDSKEKAIPQTRSGIVISGNNHGFITNQGNINQTVQHISGDAHFSRD